MMYIYIWSRSWISHSTVPLPPCGVVGVWYCMDGRYDRYGMYDQSSYGMYGMYGMYGIIGTYGRHGMLNTCSVVRVHR